jgi:hypothetical protein
MVLNTKRKSVHLSKGHAIKNVGCPGGKLQAFSISAERERA